MKPDTFHLHQLLYSLLIRKLSISKSYLNSITGILINIYLFVIILLAMTVMENSKLQLCILVINIFNYLLLYTFLNRNNKLGNK